MLEKIQSQLKDAMRAKDKERTNALRNILAKLKKAKIDKAEDLTAEESLKVVQSHRKQLDDSFSQYTKAGREDLASAEKYELDVCDEFLPAAMTEDEIATIVSAQVQALGAEGMKDMGKVMGAVMKEIAGRGDGKLAQKLVREALR